jgi:hypothetical protein
VARVDGAGVRGQARSATARRRVVEVRERARPQRARRIQLGRYARLMTDRRYAKRTARAWAMAAERARLQRVRREIRREVRA